MKGKLYIVSTPIGNLKDITLRALEVLKDVDLVACEDTRTSRKLLNHFNIKTELTSFHEHNESEKTAEIIKIINDGKNVALISDAGTPCISDPGYKLVNNAVKDGIEVVPIPGASAVLSALSVSGLPTDSFIFLGFLPRSSKKMKDFMVSIKDNPQSLIIYESPRRVIKTLISIQEILGDRRISLSREITKMYEETIRGNISEIIKDLESRESVKGEITFIVEGSLESANKIDMDDIRDRLAILNKEGLSLKESVNLLSEEGNYPKKILYSTALEIWGK